MDPPVHRKPSAKMQQILNDQQAPAPTTSPASARGGKAKGKGKKTAASAPILAVTSPAADVAGASASPAAAAPAAAPAQLDCSASNFQIAAEHVLPVLSETDLGASAAPATASPAAPASSGAMVAINHASPSGAPPSGKGKGKGKGPRTAKLTEFPELIRFLVMAMEKTRPWGKVQYAKTLKLWIELIECFNEEVDSGERVGYERVDECFKYMTVKKLRK